jgi:hypothetical protein
MLPSVTVGSSADTEGHLSYVVGNPSIVFDSSIQDSTSDPNVYIGIFPASYVCWDDGNHSQARFEVSEAPSRLRGIASPPVPHLNASIKDQSKDIVLGVIHETIQDWSSRLPGYLASRRYKLFDAVTKEIRLLSSTRRQLLSTLLTRTQRLMAREEALKTMARGNAYQDLYIIRHPVTGKTPTVKNDGPDDWHMTPLRLYLAAVASFNIPKTSAEEERLARLYLTHPGKGIPSLQDIRSAIRSPPSPGGVPRLIAEVKATIVPTNPGESLELYLSVYDNSPNKKAFITEEFLYQAMKGGHITDKTAAVFELTDLVSSLFLVIKVVRIVSAIEGSYKRYPFGIAITPLNNVLESPQERVLHVIPWTPDMVFASMYEHLVDSAPAPNPSK